MAAFLMTCCVGRGVITDLSALYLVIQSRTITLILICSTYPIIILGCHLISAKSTTKKGHILIAFIQTQILGQCQAALATPDLRFSPVILEDGVLPVIGVQSFHLSLSVRCCQERSPAEKISMPRVRNLDEMGAIK